MVIGIATAKVTLTLQREEVEEIQALVAAGEAASVPGFVQHAVKVALQDAIGWRELLDSALGQTGGPLKDHEREWADRLLEPPEQKKGPKKGKAA